MQGYEVDVKLASLVVWSPVHIIGAILPGDRGSDGSPKSTQVQYDSPRFPKALNGAGIFPKIAYFLYGHISVSY